MGGSEPGSSGSEWKVEGEGEGGLSVLDEVCRDRTFPPNFVDFVSGLREKNVVDPSFLF